MNSTTTTLADLDNGPLRDRIESLPYTEDAKDQVRAELERVDVVIDAHVLTGTALDYWHERRAMLAANLADFGRGVRPMTQRQWDALEAAEKPLYGYGTHAYTDVTPREESGDSIVAKMWEAAEENILNNAETDTDDDDLREEAARRVAAANAILVFGTDFLTGPPSLRVGDGIRIAGKAYTVDTRTSSDPLGVGRNDGDRYILRDTEGR